MAKQRESWGSKIGVIFAVAGSAIGLGNFLRFPVKAATNGGGAFLIPYFVAFLFLGIPLAWVEWTLGRYGGKYSHGSGPGILNAVVRRPWAKYLGSLGILGPLLIYFYYVYIESWLLGFAWYSLSGELAAAVSAGSMKSFFSDFIMLKTIIFEGVPAALFFFAITYILNFLVIFFGVRRGIEVLNKFALPLIFSLGLVLLVSTFMVPGIGRGLGYMWNPDFSKLLDADVWLEAAGQIFFTLSVGIGVILTYASYVHKNQDIALSSLTACAANEFAEVILGGTIVIPLAIVIYGATNIDEVAKMGTFGLGFNTMPMIFGRMHFGSLLRFVWFMLLFIAGITSSISLLQPPVSFFEDEFGMKKRSSVLLIFTVCLVMSLVAVFGLGAGAVDEMDFWGGTFALVLFGTIEAFIFAWVFGVDRGYAELNKGADIRVAGIFKFVFRFIMPAYLVIVLVSWFYQKGWGFITLRDVKPADVTFLGMKMSNIAFIAGLRISLLALLIVINILIYIAWKTRKLDERLDAMMKEE